MKKLITLDDGTKYMSSLRIQLKCTSSVSQYTDDEEILHYKLKVKNFNDLCTRCTTPIILGLLVFAELDESEEYRQLSIFSDEEQCANSLTRKVTKRIMSNVSNIKANIDNGEIDKLISEDEGTMISANFYEALTGMNISEQDTAIEFIAQWSPVVKTNRCDQDRIILTHDYYQPITMAIEKLRETINTHTKIVGRVKKLESIPDASKRTNGKVTIVYLDENDSKKTVSVQLAKDDYNKAIEAHESGSHVEVIGEIEDNGKRKKLMTAEAFSIID